MNDSLREFLCGERGHNLLHRAGRNVLGWLRGEGVPSYLAQYENVDEVVNELVLFILEREPLLQELEQAVESGQVSHFCNLIVSSFKHYIQDLRRTDQGSAWHALYRKAARLLSTHPDFLWLGRKEGSYFAVQGHGEPASPGAMRFDPQIAEKWPAPFWDHGRELEKNLVQAAQEVWREATIRNGGPFFLALRDFLSVLAARGLVDVRSRETITDEDDSGHGPVARLSAPDQFQSISLDVELLQALALRIVDAWDEDMVQAFHLVYGEQVTLENAAQKMGYSWASGVSYPLRKARTNLREMVSLWPELFEAGDEVPEQEIFLGFLLECCRSRYLRTGAFLKTEDGCP